jgi:hypothetical protein
MKYQTALQLDISLYFINLDAKPSRHRDNQFSLLEPAYKQNELFLFLT